MHKRAKDYVADAAKPLTFGRRVVEMGSININGAVRDLFLGADEYVGIDVRAGRGVDVVCDAALWGDDACCEVVVCTEVLEHAENAEAIVANAYRILKPGGAFILTAAGPERKPHGNNGGDLGDEFYRHVSEELLIEWLETAGFIKYEIDLTDDGEDIRATAVKAEKKAAAKDA